MWLYMGGKPLYIIQRSEGKPLYIIHHSKVFPYYHIWCLLFFFPRTHYINPGLLYLTCCWSAEQFFSEFQEKEGGPGWKERLAVELGGRVRGRKKAFPNMAPRPPGVLDG